MRSRFGKAHPASVELAGVFFAFGERAEALSPLAYFEHYHRWRCHRSLAMDCPAPRPVQGPKLGQVVEVAEAGGLFHHYERRAA